MSGRISFLAVLTLTLSFLLSSPVQVAMAEQAPLPLGATQPAKSVRGGEEANPRTPTAFSGRVLSAAGIAVSGATVHLIPTTAIDMTPITASDVYYPPYRAQAYDEPLEDAISARGAQFPKQRRTRKAGLPSIMYPMGSSLFM